MKYKTPSGKASELYLSALNQPHFLIAGCTGSGKSVVVNGMIYTALFRIPGDYKDSAQFILIDPKRVELCKYKSLPHVLRYSSEPEQMVSSLQYAMQIVENRFKDMQRKRIVKYDGGDIYIFIDEWADLMVTNKKAVVPVVQRLCQIGRAAKVHLILCTQSPISKIITTEIKVNFDSRLGLRTRSKQDSRNIIGISGLESLPRYGEGYYMSPEEEGLVSVPMISEYDIDSMINFWIKQRRILLPIFHKSNL